MSRANTAKVTFKAYVLVPQQHVVCDQWGDSREKARVAGRSWTVTRLVEDPEYKQEASIRVAPEPAPAMRRTGHPTYS